MAPPPTKPKQQLQKQKSSSSLASLSSSASQGGSRYRVHAQVIAFYLIVLQVTTMLFTAHHVKRQQDTMNANLASIVEDCESNSNINSGNSNNKNKQDFLTRPKKRAKGITSSSSSSNSNKKISRMATGLRGGPTSSDGGVQGSDQCMALLDKFHDLNERYRAGDDSVSPPFINYVYYKSQGFGTLIDQSTTNCVLAMAMDRPCALDFTDRDPYYTWRHFIHTGTYDWEMTGPLQEYLPEVKQAIGELPGDSVGENNWNPDEIHGTYSKIHLMHTQPADWPPPPRRTNVKDFEKHLEAWSRDKIPQAMLSPNWATAWFPRLQIPDPIQGCNRDELQALLQNALYQPTPLALKLHHERMAQVLEPPPPVVVEENDGGKKKAKKKAPDVVTLQQPLFQQHEPYGAIHVRTVILKKGKGGKEKMQNLLPTLVQCLHHVRSQLLSKDIKRWWILSDKAPVAVDLANNITDFEIVHAYNLDDGFHDNNAHSALPSARSAFAHTLMAPSISDWLVLHESDVAVVTEGRFGDSGARGNGKYPRQKKGTDEGCFPFQVFY